MESCVEYESIHCFLGMTRPGPIENRDMWHEHIRGAAAWEDMWETYGVHVSETLAAFISMCDEDEHCRKNKHPGFQAAKEVIYQRFGNGPKGPQGQADGARPMHRGQ